MLYLNEQSFLRADIKSTEELWLSFFKMEFMKLLWEAFEEFMNITAIENYWKMVNILWNLKR